MKYRQVAVILVVARRWITPMVYGRKLAMGTPTGAVTLEGALLAPPRRAAVRVAF